MARVVRRTLRCSRAQSAEIRDRAAALGMPVSGFLVACALHEDADEPGLALSEAEQRRLLDRVDRLAMSLLSAASGGSIERLRQSVELLLMTTLRDLVRQGREDELGPLLREVFGPDDGPLVERQFREWMAKEPPLLA